ncbi:MAG TPA: metallophosphoesterase [Solirubrobacterales bacterium]
MGRTVVVSDLHLASTGENDLARVPVFQDRLLAEVEGAERVVLLGDIVELRDRPIGDALAVAAPFFDALGEAAAGAEVVFVPGNHDHHLFSSWRESERLRAGSGPMELEQIAKVTSGPIRVLAERLPDSEVLLAYPGIWLAEGVYATHGHYLDVHLTVPTFERLGVGAVERVIGGLPAHDRTPDDYERVLAPLYAFLFSLAQSGGSASSGPGPSARVWAALAGGQSGFERVKGMLLGSVALPGAIAVANRLGIGRFNPDLSLAEISRATLAAMIEAVERLEIEADTVIFGHTHRRGPQPGEAGWKTKSGTKVVNTGSWVYSPGLLRSTSAESPYWPGTIAVLDGAEVELRFLLDDAPHAQLRHGLEDAAKLTAG